MRRFALVLTLLGLASPASALYSPAKVSAISVTSSQTNSGVVPTYTTHTVNVENDCKFDNYMSVEVECGEDAVKIRSPQTTGQIIDSEPPLCVTEYTFANACLRLNDGAVDDIIRVYDRNRNTVAYRKEITADPALTQLFLTYVYTYPESGNVPFDPTFSAVVNGGADADYVWWGDCDDNPATSGANTDGYEITFGSDQKVLTGTECDPFLVGGTHRVRIRVKDEAGSACPGTGCLDFDMFAEAIDETISVASFQPSVTSGAAPLNGVEFSTALNLIDTSCDYDGNWSAAISCTSSYAADCGVGDTDCSDDDGCCFVDNLAGSTFNTNTVDFNCDYATPGIYTPGIRASCGSTYTDRVFALSVGTPASFNIQPVVTPTTAAPLATFTMSNPTCSGTATGAITAATLTWDLGQTAPAPVTLQADCTWSGAAPTKAYNTSGTKVIQLCATRENVQDCSETQLTVSYPYTLGAAITEAPNTGSSPLTGIDVTVDFTGTCPNLKTISNTTCGNFCTGNFNVTNTAADPYVATDACSCTTGTSTPFAQVTCGGAPNWTGNGQNIIVGDAASFDINPTLSAYEGTAPSSPISVASVACTGTATGAITGATITMDKDVSPPTAATISNTCVLTSSHSKSYNTPGIKTVEICATRQGILACSQATVNITEGQTTGGTLTANPLVGTNGALAGVDMTFDFTGTCPGPWTISNSTCGTFGVGSFNGPATTDPFTFVDTCTYTSGSSVPSATVSCGTATPAQVQGEAVVVAPPDGGPTFSLSVTSVPASGAADAECDAHGCYLRSDIATTCSGTATGYINEGTIHWIPPTPTFLQSPIGAGWYDVPVAFNETDCSAEIAWSPTGRRYPVGTWEYEICTTRQGVPACARGSVTATDPSSTGMNLTGTGTVGGTVQVGTAAYLDAPANKTVTLTNSGNATGTYTCHTVPETLEGGVSAYPHRAIIGAYAGTLVPGASTNFVFMYDHRGPDHIANTSDDVPISTSNASLTCANDANGSDEVVWNSQFIVSAAPYIDLETEPPGTNTLTFVVTEGDPAPASQSIYLTSIGGTPAPFTVTKPGQNPVVYLNCTVIGGTATTGTAPPYPAKIEYRCTPPPGLTRTQCPAGTPPVCSTTHTITRDQ